jgi:hypothetical protein
VKEHIMRKFIIALGSVVLSTAVPAQQVLQCVNPDVLNSLVFNARPESKLVVKPGMPDDVAGFRAPAGFTLVGTGVRGQNASTAVAYKTTLESTAALDRLVGFLSDEGWKRETFAQVQALMATVPGPQPVAATLCRNGERRNVRVQETGGTRYAIISGFQSNPARACGVAPPQQGFSNPMAAINAARGNLPRFTLPDSARMGAGAPGEFGSGGVATSSMRIDSPDTAASLSRHLGRQLVEQGWRSDAEWNGKLSTGSTWSRRNADGQTLWGTLEILSRGGISYDVGFSLASQSL